MGSKFDGPVALEDGKEKGKKTITSDSTIPYLHEKYDATGETYCFG